jgi:hypothetical protein
VFRREWVSVLLSYVAFYGEADHVFMSKADRIFTMLLRQPHNEIEHKVQHLPGATDRDALYRQADHKQLIGLARDKCRTLLKQTVWRVVRSDFDDRIGESVGLR